MRSTRWLLVGLLVAAGCASKKGFDPNAPQCSNGSDDDHDGFTDFPDDPGCTSPQDDSEDSGPSPECSDGRDNDGDGLVDFPADPGCFAPQQNDETDDCPSGPNCPQCSNGIDDDGNGLIDFPNDPGCSSASDTDEYTENPVACGPDVHIKQLPFGNDAMGMFSSSTGSALVGACGGSGTEDVYEIRVLQPKVIVASTNNAGTQVDTVLYLRSADCTNVTNELACSDNISPSNTKSSITVAVMPGTYYLVVDSANTSVAGAYDLTVKFFVGEGVPCMTGDDCGPGLVCKVPTGGTTKVCSKQNCRNGIDDDGDGFVDYPNDPGCDSPTDDDETDDCPSGPMCPACGNGRDDDADGKTDYPMDPQCIAASSTSEACSSHEAVAQITQGMTMGDTTSATSDFNPTCAFDTGVPDLTYRLDVPALNSLSINVTTTGGWFPETELLNSTCGGTALLCSYTPPAMTKTNLAAGTYYVVVDGDSTSDFGPFTLAVSGEIKNLASCESALAQSGVLVCAPGYACKGTVGSRTCRPAACNDGLDNDGDGKIDYPNDPGCGSPGDDTEANPATPPVCANMMDDDMDGTTDYPADFGCVAASGTSEQFCTGETDVMGKVTTKTTTGTTAGKANDLMPGCGSSSAPDVSYALQLPVAVASLQIDTLGTTFDTVLTFHDANCAMELKCDDDFNGTLQSGFVLSNVLPGGYAITIDGYSTNSGAYTLNVRGTVAAGTVCNTPLFSGGAAAVLVCPTGTTCSTTTHKCQ